MHPSMNNWLPDRQGSAATLSASQIFIELNQLYAVLQIYYPSWCQENPLCSLVEGLSDTDLCGLVVNWKKWIEDFQTQLSTAAPMV